jgi:hypothetical protein
MSHGCLRPSVSSDFSKPGQRLPNAKLRIPVSYVKTLENCQNERSRNDKLVDSKLNFGRWLQESKRRSLRHSNETGLKFEECAFDVKT